MLEGSLKLLISNTCSITSRSRCPQRATILIKLSPSPTVSIQGPGVNVRVIVGGAGVTVAKLRVGRGVNVSVSLGMARRLGVMTIAVCGVGRAVPGKMFGN